MAYPKVNLRPIKRKKGTSYFIDYNDNGKRVRRVVEGNKHTAQKIRDEIQRRLSLGQFDIFKERAVVIPYSLLYEEYKTSKKHIIRDSSLTRYKNFSERFITFMQDNFPEALQDISKIKSTYIKECLDDSLDENTEYGELWSRKTANGLRTHLKTLFDFAIKRKYLTDNPVADIQEYPVDSTTKVEFFTDPELAKIWKTVDKYWQPILEFILHTGLRKGEAINLIWENVDLTGKSPSITIISRDDWKTKTGQHRTIPLNQRAIEILKSLPEKKCRYVFTSTKGNRISPDDPYHALKTALNKLKLNGDVHKLRHTFASKLVMAGETLYTVGKLLGHTDSKTTQIYAHLSPDHLRGAVDKMVRNNISLSPHKL